MNEHLDEIDDELDELEEAVDDLEERLMLWTRISTAYAMCLTTSVSDDECECGCEGHHGPHHKGGCCHHHGPSSRR